MARFTRIAGSFLVVITTWWVYSLAAVPLIEPEESRHEGAAPSQLDRQLALSAVREQRAGLGCWFSGDDWELTSPKIVETRQGKLLLKRWWPDPDDEYEVHLEPCTMIFMPEGRVEDEAERQRRAVVLRAPEARLRFDEKIDLPGGKLGKRITGGQLIGAVAIRSQQRSPGPEDDLLITTRDVTLQEERITTPHRVDFIYGPNRGNGVEMLLLLTTPAEKAAAEKAGAGPPPGAVKLFQLEREVSMRIEPGDAELFPAPAGPTKPVAPRGPGKANPPVEVTCLGAFQFDAHEYKAVFHDHVEVLRLNAEGGSDQMLCERLTLTFEPDPTAGAKSGAANEAAAGNDKPSGGMPKLRPKSLSARGNPVRLNSPSRGVEARGQRLEYDIQKRSGKLTDPDEAMLQQLDPVRGELQEVHAPRLDFESAPPESPGPPRMVRAWGRGWLRGNPPSNPGQTLTASWLTGLHFRPFKGSQVLSIWGKAHVAMSGSGGMDAESIHLWLRPAASGAAAGATAGSPGQSGFSPQRMLAQGHVHLNSPEMEAWVGVMRVWFTEPPPAPVAAPADPNAPPPPPPPPKQESLPKRRYLVSGDVLHGQAIFRGGKWDVSEMTLDGHMQCKERPLAAAAVAARTPRGEPMARTPRGEPTDDEPLVITGDQLHLTQPTPENATVEVVGQPARVDARKMTLIGGDDGETGSIVLHRATNHLSIPGPGTLALPIDQDMQGRPLAEPQPLTITWRGRLEFDGQEAQFEDHVVARNTESTLRTPLLRTIFSEPVHFGGEDERPQIDRLVCRQGVQIEHCLREAGRLAAWERLDARDLDYEYVSGDILAHGPGSITRTWIDDGESPALMPAAPAPRNPAGPGRMPVRQTSARPDARPKAQAQASAKHQQKTLVYLNSTFELEMTGNQRRENVMLHRRVVTVYGPINDWRGKLDANRPETVGERGFVLNCDQLETAKSDTTDAKGSAMVLVGRGNAVIEGTDFVARADRLTYKSTTDRLVLEGNGRTPAELMRQVATGARPQKTAAGRISYWPKTQWVQIDDFRSLDFSILQANDDAKDAPPAPPLAVPPTAPPRGRTPPGPPRVGPMRNAPPPPPGALRPQTRGVTGYPGR